MVTGEPDNPRSNVVALAVAMIVVSWSFACMPRAVELAVTFAAAIAIGIIAALAAVDAS